VLLADADMSRDPSVLQIIGTARRGGAESVGVLLATELQGLGIRSAVLCCTDGPMRRELDDVGLPNFIVPVRPASVLSSIWKLRSTIARERFDVVHTHGPKAMLLGNVAARLAGASAIVTTLHEFASVRRTRTRLHPAYELIEQTLGRWCTDCCVAYSDGVKDDALRRGLPEAKVRRIYNGVDTERFAKIRDAQRVEARKRHLGLRPGDVVVGAVGRLITVKGHRHLISALPIIRQRVPSARVVIVGDGPLRDELTLLAQREGVARDVIFAGDTGDTPLLYGCFDVLVYPSVMGAFGLVVLEAMACSLPVISSELTGTTELITNGQTGLLVKPGDSQAIAAAVTGLALDPDRRERLASAGHQHVVTHFSARTFARQYLELYRSLLERRVPMRDAASR
jgi:glycosyltransferase involved in cell wall biosynthesis